MNMRTSSQSQRHILGIAMILIFTLLLAACQPTATPTAGPTAAPTKAPAATATPLAEPEVDLSAQLVGPLWLLAWLWRRPQPDRRRAGRDRHGAV